MTGLVEDETNEMDLENEENKNDTQSENDDNEDVWWKYYYLFVFSI